MFRVEGGSKVVKREVGGGWIKEDVLGKFGNDNEGGWIAFNPSKFIWFLGIIDISFLFSPRVGGPFNLSMLIEKPSSSVRLLSLFLWV